MTNVGFFDGTGVVWPVAPMLHGITMQLLELKLADCGLPSRRAPVRLPGLASFAAAFVTNARGIAAVGQIDDLAYLVKIGLILGFVVRGEIDLGERVINNLQ